MTDFGYFELIWMFFTFIVMGKWFWRSDYGRKALTGCEMPGNSFQAVDVIIAFVVYMFMSAATGVFLKEESPFENKLIVSSIAGFVSAAGLLFLINYRLTNGLSDLLKLKPIAVIFYAIVYSVPAIGAAGVLFSLTVVISSAFGYEQVQRHAYLEEVFGSGNPELVKVLLLYISAGIVTPIIEETLFRGIILNVLNKLLGKPWIAIFVSAILFAIMHADKQHWPALFALGSFFGYSMVKRQSLAVPILMHAIFNCYTITNVLVSGMPK